MRKKGEESNIRIYIQMGFLIWINWSDPGRGGYDTDTFC